MLYVVDEDGKADTTPCIVEELKSRGVMGKSGKLKDMPGDTARVVKTDENGMWDLGTYLLGLEIKFTNPKTQAVMADAYIKRASPEGNPGGPMTTVARGSGCGEFIAGYDSSANSHRVVGRGAFWESLAGGARFPYLA
jgi:hypothetical protein